MSSTLVADDYTEVSQILTVAFSGSGKLFVSVSLCVIATSWVQREEDGCSREGFSHNKGLGSILGKEIGRLFRIFRRLQANIRATSTPRSVNTRVNRKHLGYLAGTKWNEGDTISQVGAKANLGILAYGERREHADGGGQADGRLWLRGPYSVSKQTMVATI